MRAGKKFGLELGVGVQKSLKLFFRDFGHFWVKIAFEPKKIRSNPLTY